MMNQTKLRLLAAGATLITTIVAVAQEHDPAMHSHHAAGGAPAEDTRVLVQFPDALRQHTLANMRGHLQTGSRIQAALAAGHYDQAGEIAEQNLGMSSLKLHGASEVAPHMPPAMREAGTAMHRAASRFAVAVNDTAVSGDIQPALAALSEVTEACVACHSGFRLQ